MLLMDLLHVIGLFLDGGLQPAPAFFGGSMAACAVCPSPGVIVPWWVGDQGAAFDPVHVIVGRGYEIDFVHNALHVAKVRAEVQHV